MERRSYNRVREQLGHHGPYLPVILEACSEDQLAYEYKHGVTPYGAFTYLLSSRLRLRRLQGKTPTVTIARVVLETVGQQRQTKPAIYFVGKTKGLLLNKTCARAVAAIAGSTETDDWTGVAVTLYASTATFGTEKHDVIRIKAPAIVAAPPLPRILTDELEIDLADAGVRR